MEKLKRFDPQNAEILDKKGMKEVIGRGNFYPCADGQIYSRMGCTDDGPDDPCPEGQFKCFCGEKYLGCFDSIQKCWDECK